MTRKRESYWISGLDFFEFKNSNCLDVSELFAELFNGSTLPVQFKEYLLKLEPIDTTDPIYYLDNIKAPQNCKYILDDSILVNPNFRMFTIPFYDLGTIVKKITSSDVSHIFTKYQIAPICESVPNGDIVVSLKNDSSHGKLYYITDHYDFELVDEFLFCNCLFDFISGISRVPSSIWR